MVVLVTQFLFYLTTRKQTNNNNNNNNNKMFTHHMDWMGRGKGSETQL